MRCLRVGSQVCVGALASFVVLLVVWVVPALAALPEGRAYEQVSPEFKAGYPVAVGFGPSAVMALDGESVKFLSYGAFSGSGSDYGLNPYVARRTGHGWVTSALLPPRIEGEFLAGLEEMSPDLSKFEYLGSPSTTAYEQENVSIDTVWLREPDGSFVRVSPAMSTAGGVENAMSVRGASSDLSRLVIGHEDSPREHILAGDETETGDQLFESEGSSLRLVALDDKGKQLTLSCDVKLGGGESAFGAVSQPGGSEVFFNPHGGGGCNSNASTPAEVLVRVNGSETLDVSAPLPGGCTEGSCLAAEKAPAKNAVFQGASENGGRVFFTTTQPLVNGDTDQGNDLYMARVGCAGGLEGEACGAEPREVLSLVQVSHDPHGGQAAEVEPNVLAVSPDGSRVYFVARGVLSENTNGEDEKAVLGAENLYVYHATGASETVSFVADLNAAQDAHLWSGNEEDGESQTTGNGAFLVFGSYAQLIKKGPEADTDTAKDIYLYDAETGGLRRVSIGEAGADGNGNNRLFNANIRQPVFSGSLQQQYELGTRAVSEDGSTVVFTSKEPLSADATNGQQDVYVWHEGSVGMISSGSSTEPDEEPVISPSGRDIMFLTSAGLLPGDTDGLRDLYDARIKGGFPLPEAAREPCSGDACQGPLSTPAPLLVAGSISQPSGGNFPVPVVVKAKSKGKSVKSKRRKAKSKRGKGARQSARKHVQGGRGR